MKYVTITNGSLGFYDTNIHTTIPSGAYEITDADYTTFFSDQGKYTFEAQDSKAVLVELTTVYFASDHGMTVVSAMSNTATPSGAVKFTSKPTESDLITAFPSVASSRTFTVTTNAVTGDTLTILGQALTLGTTVSVGDTIETTVANIATHLNSLKVVTGNYKVVANGSSLVVSEAFAGGGIVIPDATTTGTLKMASGTATESVWGYTTQLKHEHRVALEASADTIRDTYCKNYIVAMAKGDTTGAQAVLDSITALNDNLYKAMEAINNG